MSTRGFSHGDIPAQRIEDCVAILTGATDLGLAEDDITGLTQQTGGLFNFLLRVDTVRGSFYFKQYLDGVSNAVFKPPEIPAAGRSVLAYEVQREACEATAMMGKVVPRIIHFDTERCAFLMEPANGTTPLIDLLSTGVIPQAAVTLLPATLGHLHEATYRKFEPSTVYGNMTFRDFKLGLQYDDIANRLEPAEAATVMMCKEAYRRRQVCVTHGDPNSRNVVIGNETVGVFDYEQSHLGAPAYDIAYILSELFITTEYFGRRREHVEAMGTFLDSYFKVFTAEDRADVERETTTHLAIQMIYRFWGPSRASWTFYIPDGEKGRVLATARGLLSDDPLPVSEWVHELTTHSRSAAARKKAGFLLS